MANFIQTSEDVNLRVQVADAILHAMAEDPAFAEPKTFAKWQKQHKALLVGLFGGRGIQNIFRVVAWCRRQALGQPRDPPEILCLVHAALQTQSHPLLVSALAEAGIHSVTD